MKKKQNYKKLAGFFYEIGTLRKVARAHRQTLLTNDLSDNISSHSYRVTIIAWHLALLENADPYKTVLMALFHDAAEARSNDHNWVHKKYVKIFEEEILKDQFQDLTSEKILLPIMKEYSKRESKEAKIAKDADLLDQTLLLKEYVRQGNQEANSWLESKLNSSYERYFTKSAQEIFKEIKKQTPGDWWKTSWSNKNR